MFGAALALTVTVVALVLLDHHRPATQALPSGATPALAQAADPSGGLPWALRVRATGTQTCVQLGRLHPTTIGVITHHPSSNFRSISPRVFGPRRCVANDAHGHAFLNVFGREVPASAGTGSTIGQCQAGARRGLTPPCPLKDLRNVAYGLLGPDAVAITYTVNGHSITKRTAGSDGAYLVVLPATNESCFLGPRGGRSCEGGAGETSATTLESGALTAVTYRDGHVCRLPAPTAAGTPAGSCPPVGYAPPKTQPFRPPHIAAARVTAPISVVTFPPARQLCYRAYPEQTRPCDHGVPRGYKVAFAGLGGQRLVLIGFTARLAATNQHSVYEWALSGQNCSGSGSGTSATTMAPIRAGQHVVLRTTVSPCRGRYTGLVTYQPNGWPGHDTLGARQDFSGAPVDGSTVVGRFSFVVP